MKLKMKICIQIYNKQLQQENIMKIIKNNKRNVINNTMRDNLRLVRIWKEKKGSEENELKKKTGENFPNLQKNGTIVLVGPKNAYGKDYRIKSK